MLHTTTHIVDVEIASVYLASVLEQSRINDTHLYQSRKSIFESNLPTIYDLHLNREYILAVEFLSEFLR